MGRNVVTLMIGNIRIEFRQYNGGYAGLVYRVQLNKLDALATRVTEPGERLSNFILRILKTEVQQGYDSIQASFP
jgi:hypothetical protein